MICCISTYIYYISGFLTPGLTRPTARSPVKNLTGKQRNTIDKAFKAALKEEITAWRTILELAMKYKTSTLPALILLEDKRIIAAERIRKLDNYHNPRLQTFKNTEYARSRSQLRTTSRDRQTIASIHDPPI